MFQLSGLASGLDTKSLIDQLIALERKPILKLQDRKTSIQKENSAFQAINTRLSALKNKLSDLTLDKVLKAKSVASTDSAIVSGSASSGAAAGSYRVRVDRLATATTNTSGTRIGQEITSTTTALKDLNFSAAPTGGTFTLRYSSGGTATSATITIADTDTLDDVFTKISTASGGAITGSLTGNRITLQGDASVSDLSTGAVNDTSNFLRISNLASASFDAGTNSVVSTSGMGVTQAGKTIDSGTALVTPITATTAGEFEINGVKVSYDTSTDSINSIISKINNSTAGVIASYNAVDDKITLTSRSTGSSALSLQDNSGNFLAATGLVGPNQQMTVGQDAAITVEGVNGGMPITSNTNDFKEVVPGLTITAKKVDANYQTLNVNNDTETTVNAIKAFVSDYNSVVDAIDAARAKGQPLAFDSDLRTIQTQLMGMVGSAVAGLSDAPNTLGGIGIGTTKEDKRHLTVDDAKLRKAIADNPDRVAEIFRKTSGTTPQGIAARMNKYIADLGGTSGVFATRSKATSSQMKLLDDQIKAYERRIDMKRTALVKQFTAMEKAVSQMKNQQAAFLSQLGALQGGR